MTSYSASSYFHFYVSTFSFLIICQILQFFEHKIFEFSFVAQISDNFLSNDFQKIGKMTNNILNCKECCGKEKYEVPQEIKKK